MNIVDLILALGLFWAIRKGWQIGLVQSLVSLLSIVLAYGFALTYGETAARRIFSGADDLDGGAALLGFLAVFALVLLLCYLLGRLLHKTLMASPLGMVDAIGGGVLGLGKGLLIFGLLAIFCRQYPIHSRAPELIDNALLGPPVQKYAMVIADGVQAAFPKTRNFLENIGLKPQKPPPLVDKLNKSADEARQKIQDIIDESRKNLEGK